MVEFRRGNVNWSQGALRQSPSWLRRGFGRLADSIFEPVNYGLQKRKHVSHRAELYMTRPQPNQMLRATKSSQCSELPNVFQHDFFLRPTRRQRPGRTIGFLDSPPKGVSSLR